METGVPGCNAINSKTQTNIASTLTQYTHLMNSISWRLGLTITKKMDTPTDQTKTDLPTGNRAHTDTALVQEVQVVPTPKDWEAANADKSTDGREQMAMPMIVSDVTLKSPTINEDLDAIQIAETVTEKDDWKLQSHSSPEEGETQDGEELQTSRIKMTQSFGITT